MKPAPFRDKPGMKKLAELIEVLLWSGFIEGERPISAVFVAPPGAGKSTLLEVYDSPYSPFLSDATSRELSALMKEKTQATHLIIGDLMSVLRHKKGTSTLTINMLSQLSGETMRNDAFSGQAIRRRMGVISAIPPYDMESTAVKRVFNEGGFASRFLIAKYDYTPETISKIHQYIERGLYRKQDETISLAVGPPMRKIFMSKEMASEVKELALLIRRDPIGARAHHYLRTLAMSIAARDASRNVLPRHMKTLAGMSEFFTARGVLL